MKVTNNPINLLDIGSKKMCLLCAEMQEDSKIPHIVGFTEVESQGIANGQVTNIQQATEAIEKLFEKAEETCEVHVNNCFVTISGDHIRSLKANGRIAISGDPVSGFGSEAREIEQEDIDRVLEHASALPMPVDRDILHIEPVEYIVDDKSGIKNPLNLNGRRMEVKVHLTTYSRSESANLTKCIKENGSDINLYVLQSLASASGVLDENERKLGTILIDIGDGTTDYIVFFNDAIQYTGVLNVGAYSVTNDLAYLLRIPLEQAEELKINHGAAKIDMVDEGEMIDVESIGGRPAKQLSRKTLAEYIEPRVEEILKEIHTESQKANIPNSRTFSVVLTGGGANLAGLKELAESIFETNVRVASPAKFTGFEEKLKKPEYAATVGLANYIFQQNLVNAGKRKKTKGFMDSIKKLVEKFV